MDSRSQALVRSITAVTKKWTTQRKKEERDERAMLRRQDAMISSRRVTIQEAAFAVMEQAYLKASAGGKLPAHARQIMYAARGPIQEMTDRDLNDQYFTQQLLPDYMETYPEKTRNWDVVFDARGHFTEPHTGQEVPLGTLPVREYLAAHTQSCYLPVSMDNLIELYPTHGARHRFSAVLFLEKEGFLPLLQKVRLAERYDVAIMSTKGMSSTAARTLVDSVCHREGVPLLMVRDFDKAGFSIAATLQNDTRRYRFRNALQVYDLGLRLDDVQEWNLESETVSYGRSDPSSNLESNGATTEEIAFLCSGSTWAGYEGRRVELNAFASDQFVKWLEAKLGEYGIQKVIPEQDALADAYRRALKAEKLRRIMVAAESEVDRQIRQYAIPQDLAARIGKAFDADQELPWDSAIARFVLEAEHGA